MEGDRVIDLSDYEGAAKDPKHYREKLKKLQARLERIQVAHIVHRRPAVVMLEGWDAAGKAQYGSGSARGEANG